MALLVVVCGCRVGAGVAPLDAEIPSGDGLPERVTTDAALWSDVRGPETAGTSDGVGDRSSSDVSARDAVGEVGGAACSLLNNGCPGREACYPYPFEGSPSGQTRCSFQGVGRQSVPCQSQVECDGASLCVTPGQPDAVCLQRCDPNAPSCPPGTACLSVAGFSGAGVCTL